MVRIRVSVWANQSACTSVRGQIGPWAHRCAFVPTMCWKHAGGEKCWKLCDIIRGGSTLLRASVFSLLNVAVTLNSSGSNLSRPITLVYSDMETRDCTCLVVPPKITVCKSHPASTQYAKFQALVSSILPSTLEGSNQRTRLGV